LEAIKAEIHAGADAIYAGSTSFSARAYAKNLTIEQFKNAIDFVRLHGKKIYLTVNTLLTDQELDKMLYDIVLPLYEYGLHAVIVQDVGVMAYLREAFPELTIHASTQMGILDEESVEFFRPYQIKRVVVPRELTISQVKSFCEKSDMEVEVFVHGALCYCFSGWCLMSSMIGGRSGNRGLCAQPCRVHYSVKKGGHVYEGYYLSPKDLCTLENIPDLVEAGVHSFKIEGRMKKKEYGTLTTYLYKKYTDFYNRAGKEEFQREVRKPNGEFQKDLLHLKDVYNRGGLCRGYLFDREKNTVIFPLKNSHFGVKVGEVKEVKKNTAEMILEKDISYQDVLEFRNSDGTKEYEYTVKDGMKAGRMANARFSNKVSIDAGMEVYRTRNNALLENIQNMPEKTIRLYGLLEAKIGQNATFRIRYSGRHGKSGESVCVEGDKIERAVNHPTEESEIKKHLMRTGGTGFEFVKIDVIMDKDVFLPLRQCNQLRRKALKAWELTVLSKKQIVFRQMEPSPLLLTENADEPEIIVSVSTMRQCREALGHDKVTMVLCQLVHFTENDWKMAVDEIRSKEKIPAFTFPRLWGNRFFDNNQMGKILSDLKDAVPVVNSWKMWALLKKHNRHQGVLTDSNLYVTNKKAIAVYRSMGADGFFLPPDMSREDKRKFGNYGGIVTVYGKVPVVTTKACLSHYLDGGHGGNQKIKLENPKGDKFFVINHCKACYNTIYTEKTYIDKNQYNKIRFDFIDEDTAIMKEVFRKWKI
jgi:putative protease